MLFRSERVTPLVLRVGFTGPGLAPFAQAKPAAHMKLFFHNGAWPPPEAAALEQYRAAGVNRVVPFDIDAVLGLAAAYSRQRTAKGGHRTLDILHVATAVHLCAGEFLTFDGRQKKIARHAGLKVPF